VRDYHARNTEMRAVVRESLQRLRSAYDVVVVEGAGSPAEVNLKEHDLANMFVAEAADCRVVLVGDIDRGGVFAAFVGTLELLEPHERARIGAFLVNKFRGDVSLLEPGLRFLEKRTGVPVLGVLPYLRHLRVADEDSVSLEERLRRPRAGADEVEIAVVRLPRIANHDDFQPLEAEPGVVVRFVEDPRDLVGADLVVLPGTKSTVADLRWLRESGMAAAVVARARRGGLVLGICGGCQMLGGHIEDPHGVESSEASTEGLGLLAIDTHFARDKRTRQVLARSVAPTFLACTAGPTLTGYEIHMGRIDRGSDAPGIFAIESRSASTDRDEDGAASPDGTVVGTMIHGLFENAELRRRLANGLRERKGLARHDDAGPAALQPDEFDRLARVLRENVDVPLLLRLLG
jgi:adenosylcobyric acid synthase